MVVEKDEDELWGRRWSSSTTPSPSPAFPPSSSLNPPTSRKAHVSWTGGWNNLGSSEVSFARFEAAFFSLGSFAAEKPLPVILACSIFNIQYLIFNIPYFNIRYLIFNIQGNHRVHNIHRPWLCRPSFHQVGDGHDD